MRAGAKWAMERYAVRVAGAWPAKRSGWLVRVSFDGVEGLGEAAPMPGFSDDNARRAERALRRAFESDAWTRGWSAAEVARLAARVAIESPAAACALETAALDALGRRAGMPFAALLGCDAPREVPCNALLARGPLDAALDRLAAERDAGVGAVKVKVAREAIDADLARCARVRERLGDAFELRLDANGGWALDTATAHLRALSAFAPAFCEQPVPAGVLDALRRVPVPVAADESCAHPGELDRLLAERTPPAALVLKPMALGGPSACMRIAARGAARGVPAVVTHMLAGPVDLAAACELASALPGRALASGLQPHALLGPWTTTIAQASPSTARSALRDGLGLSIGVVPRVADQGRDVANRREA